MAAEYYEVPEDQKRCKHCHKPVVEGVFWVVNGEGTHVLKDTEVTTCPHCGQEQEFPKTFADEAAATEAVEKVNDGRIGGKARFMVIA